MGYCPFLMETPMRSKPLFAVCLLTGFALVLGTEVLFSQTLAAQPWFIAHKAQVVAGFIVGSCVLYGALEGCLLHAMCREDQEELTGRVDNGPSKVPGPPNPSTLGE